MSYEFGLEKGIEKTALRIISSDSQPVMVSIYGWPTPNKTHFIKRVAKKLSTRDKAVYTSEGGIREQTFKNIKDIMTRLPFANYVFLFDCGWERIETPDGRLVNAIEEPEYLARRILERNIDLNIGTYSPISHSEPEGEYDMVIRTHEMFEETGIHL